MPGPRVAASPASARLERGKLPVEFWKTVLGRYCSGATGFWPRWAKDTDRAESEWLELVAGRAELAAGQRVLEVGTSLGAIARWAEGELPGMEFTLMASDPASETLLRSVIASHGTDAARLASSAAADPVAGGGFDRILVVEAFTGAADPVALLRRLLSLLAPGGRLFVQLVCHWRRSYVFERGDEHRWMLFDTPDGAIMPGDEELSSILRTEFMILDRWELSGEHCERTVRAWRARMDQNRPRLKKVLARAGDPRPARTLRAWRAALVAQEVMFGFREGQEWAVTQMLLAADPVATSRTASAS